MADNSSIEQQAQEIENKNETDEPIEPSPEQIEEVPEKKVFVKFCTLLMLVQLLKVVYIVCPIEWSLWHASRLDI